MEIKGYPVVDNDYQWKSKTISMCCGEPVYVYGGKPTTDD